MPNDNSGILAIGFIIVAFFGYIFMSSGAREKDLSDTFFYYQNKDQYIDQCGEFFITQKEFVDKDDRVDELCQDFADILNRINKDLYYGSNNQEKPNCTPDNRGTECE